MSVDIEDLGWIVVLNNFQNSVATQTSYDDIALIPDNLIVFALATAPRLRQLRQFTYQVKQLLTELAIIRGKENKTIKAVELFALICCNIQLMKSSNLTHRRFVTTTAEKLKTGDFRGHETHDKIFAAFEKYFVQKVNSLGFST